MRKVLFAVAAVAAIGASQAVEADPVDLALGDMEIMTAGSYAYPALRADFAKYGVVDLYKTIDIYAKVHSDLRIHGNFADAEAFANAFGKNTYSETLTFADVVEGVMSRSGSHSVAATRGHYYHGPKRY